MWQQHVVYSCAAWESAIKAKVLTMFSNRKRRMRISIYRFLVLWISFFRFESSYLSSLCSRSLCLGCSEIKAVGWLIFSFSCDNTMKASYLHLQIPVSTFIFKTAVENHPGWKLAMKPLANLIFFSSSWFMQPSHYRYYFAGVSVQKSLKFSASSSSQLHRIPSSVAKWHIQNIESQSQNHVLSSCLPKLGLYLIVR